MFGSLFFYLLVPMFVQVVLVFSFFHIPEAMIPSLIFLPAWFILFFCFFRLVLPASVENSLKISCRKNTWRLEDSFMTVFCVIFFALVPLDIYFNGFKILAPHTYAEFNGIGRYIRHITNFSWLVVLFSSLNFSRGLVFKIMLILAFAVPIVFIDRNRLLLCFFCSFIVWYFSSNKSTIRYH